MNVPNHYHLLICFKVVYSSLWLVVKKKTCVPSLRYNKDATWIDSQAFIIN